MAVTDPKSNNRKKWLVGGLCVFGAAVLLTTGLSAYIIGKNISVQKKDIDVSVDTVSNKSLVLSAELSESKVVLGETAAVTSGVVTNDGTTIGDLAITFSSIKIEYGNEIGSGMPTKLAFSFEAAKQSNDALTVTDNKLGAIRTGTSWTYLAAPDDIAVSTFNPEVAGTSTKSRELVNKTINFKWGTFFDASSPATFYNSKLSSDTVTDEQLQAVMDELNAMKTALDGKKLQLTITAE